MRNNKIVVDLNKVQYAWCGYENQYGDRRVTNPASFTLHGEWIDPNARNIDGQLYRDYLQEKGTIDEWTFYVTFQVTANHRLTYTGEKARALWKAWSEKIFNKRK